MLSRQTSSMRILRSTARLPEREEQKSVDFGLADLFGVGVAKTLGIWVYHNAEVAWMTPLAFLPVFVPLALMLVLAGWWLYRQASRHAPWTMPRAIN